MLAACTHVCSVSWYIVLVNWIEVQHLIRQTFRWHLSDHHQAINKWWRIYCEVTYWACIYCCPVILRAVRREFKGCCTFQRHALKACGMIEVELHSFWTSGLDEGEWSFTGAGRSTPGEIIPRPLSSLDRRLGGPQGRSGQTFATTANRTRIIWSCSLA